jgi:hypothetical protein
MLYYALATEIKTLKTTPNSTICIVFGRKENLTYSKTLTMSIPNILTQQHAI